ncbi:type II toxin-antitoxin system Phd/YefM family antitoxin [Frankia sp. CpI1-P]|uniref:type II toxin-antitoxin system Phd/YefM family antitoxin n=1 Tax=Frankia sp. CpI1-P TaxID=1502734 RepID=UPI00191C341E|nr:type II toxin-antitoxin system Phd/YefM family antitoxin [Frankia sp. CpI1-P]
MAEVKARLSELVTRVQEQHDQVTVTRNGRPAAVVVSVEEWESLHETLEILSDAETVSSLRVAREEIARGGVYTTDEVLAAFRERGQQSA